MQEFLNPRKTGFLFPIHRIHPHCSAVSDGSTLLTPELINLILTMGTRRHIQKGKHLYSPGKAPEALALVTQGALKIELYSADGETSVADFFLPGEVIGAEGIQHSPLAYQVSAVRESQVLLLPQNALWHLAQDNPQLQNLYGHLMRHNYQQALLRAILIGNLDAEQKLAYVLLNIAHRLGALDPETSTPQTCQSFQLPISRTDISRYLCLSIATVSRILGRMQLTGLLDIRRNTVHYLDCFKLEQLLRHTN
ncbi:MAG: Crp/Fnr family transcriptional regulator [Pseudomonadales bacterium]|nr:Crp/Fnr family transcriptional regulator [Pseudomonadales bacterium]